MSKRVSPRWTYRPVRKAEARRIQEELGLPELVAAILANRDITDPRVAREFIDAPLRSVRDPFDLPDLEAAAERISRAIRDGERITVYGDYDVDGICATTLLVETLQLLGAAVDYYIPHREEEGYGLNREAIDRLIEGGTRLLVTVDNGISSLEEIDHAASRGVEVIVTDHHEPGETLPAASAVVNPKRADRPYPYAELSGSGVAWKLAHGALRLSGVAPEEGRRFLKERLDLVALATVADVSPLNGENRVLTRAGIRALAETRRPGLRALMDVAGVNGRIDPRTISFQIAPRLNAAGRSDSARLGVELLMEDDDAAAHRLAQRLEAMNRQRRIEEKGILDEAVKLYKRRCPGEDDRVVVIEGEGWRLGFVGLIAARLCDRYGRPAFVISLDRKRGFAKGSARSVPGFHLVEALDACGVMLNGYGGHAMAAGLNLPLDAVNAFREAMLAHAERALPVERLRPEIMIDAEFPLSALSLEAAEAFEGLEPFGEGNVRPIVSFPDVSLADSPRVVGTNHLKLRLMQGGTYVNAIGFGMGGLDSELLRHRGAFCVAGHPTLNEFQGRRTPEIQLCDLRFD